MLQSSLVPRFLWVGGREKSLVHTVCACSGFPQDFHKIYSVTLTSMRHTDFSCIKDACYWACSVLTMTSERWRYSALRLQELSTHSSKTDAIFPFEVHRLLRTKQCRSFTIKAMTFLTSKTPHREYNHSILPILTSMLSVVREDSWTLNHGGEWNVQQELVGPHPCPSHRGSPSWAPAVLPVTEGHVEPRSLVPSSTPATKLQIWWRGEPWVMLIPSI